MQKPYQKLNQMRKFYVSPHYGLSGISKYSRDFYNLVLKDEGYIHMDSSLPYAEIFSTISSRDHVHLEIGIFQAKEIEILMRMIRAKYRNIHVTLHDAPLLKYPLHDFKNSLLNKVSKFYDLHWDSFSGSMKYIKKISRIYVLSKKGAQAVARKYMTENVSYLPHVVDTTEITPPTGFNTNFIFFGFIGRNKGIEYALRLHRELLDMGLSNSQFYVAGTAMGKEKHYFDSLINKYQQNVHYLGYVGEEQLQEIFDKCTFALLPFRDYGFFYPFSGSVLQSMKKGKLVCTNNVNSISEIVTDGETGIFLTGSPRKDAEFVRAVAEKPTVVSQIVRAAQHHLLRHHSPEAIKRIFFHSQYFINN